jgi:Ca2+-binding EF-hand superfamily protein
MSKKLMIVAVAILTSSTVFAGNTFTTLDVDKNSTISEAEATTMPSLVEQWKALDVDANGELSVEEFAKYEVK